MFFDFENVLVFAFILERFTGRASRADSARTVFIGDDLLDRRQDRFHRWFVPISRHVPTPLNAPLIPLIFGKWFYFCLLGLCVNRAGSRSISRRAARIWSGGGPGQASIRKMAGIRMGRVSDIVENDPDFGLTAEEICRY